MQTTLKIDPVQPETHVANITVVEPEDALRADCYALLGAVLAAPPNQAVVDAITSIQRFDADDGAAMARAWHGLRLAGESATDLAALDDEHHALFIGVGRGELMPYGSWYLTGFLMEQPLAALRRSLTELGFERQQDVKEPEDHVAALCEVMSLIAVNNELPFEVQQGFFDNHLAPWIGQFFKDLQEAKSARFYRAVGLFGETFIDIEKHYFSMPV